MSISREEALEALRLAPAESVSAAEVSDAFQRLVRRYPPAAFPERFARLVAARDALLHGRRAWDDLVAASVLDLTWAKPFIKQDDKGPLAPRSDRELLQDMLRAALLGDEGEDDDGEDDGMPSLADIERLVGEMMRGGRRRP